MPMPNLCHHNFLAFQAPIGYIGPVMRNPSHITPVKAWLLAVRPKTLPAGVAPVLVGSALAAAHQRFALPPAAAALLGALLLQIGVNLANDYFDYVRRIDARDRQGPVRVTQSGLIAPATVRSAMWWVLGSVAVPGIYLVSVAGWPVLIIGIASILAALAYSGGPYPLASHGLGDLFVFIFFGPVAVCGTYFAQSQHFHPSALLASVPVGLLITSVLVVNNLRDLETDRRAGKRTLAVMIGPGASKIEYAVLQAGAFGSLWPMHGFSDGSPWLFLPAGALPVAIGLIRAICRFRGARLNRLLAATAASALIFSLLLSLGIILGMEPPMGFEAGHP